MLIELFLFFPGENAREQTDIYRSVGPGAAQALVSGATDNNGLDISGSTAIFDIPDPVGVGDAIQYGSDNDGVVDGAGLELSNSIVNGDGG